MTNRPPPRSRINLVVYLLDSELWSSAFQQPNFVSDANHPRNDDLRQNALPIVLHQRAQAGHHAIHFLARIARFANQQPCAPNLQSFAF
jgi:hypothetical protein